MCQVEVAEAAAEDEEDDPGALIGPIGFELESESCALS